MRTRCALVVSMAVSACGGATANSPPALPEAPVGSTAPAPASSSLAAAAVAKASTATPPGPAQLTSKPLALPGATGPAFLDYIAYEPGSARVWVPVPATGSVDVLSVAGGTFKHVNGFKTRVREVKGQRRTSGPSAVTIGDGFAYMGNRATSDVCPIDVKTLEPHKCLKLPMPTDGVAYAPSAKEVWVTNPKDHALTVLDASNPGSLSVKTIVKTDGAPEGYAVDDARGLFFTNLEDKGSTLAIDIKTHKVKATWDPGCGAAGPRGIAFDGAHDFVVVACTDHVQVLDAGHGGAPLGKLDTGAGVDNIDFANEKLYVAAGKAARLTVATIDDKGTLAIVATGATSEGARNAVADASGNVYVADSEGARLLVFAPSR